MFKLNMAINIGFINLFIYDLIQLYFHVYGLQAYPIFQHKGRHVPSLGWNPPKNNGSRVKRLTLIELNYKVMLLSRTKVLS